MKQSTLQQKAERLLSIDSRRKAHNAAISRLHATPLTGYDGYDETEQHEERGLKMWRKLRRIEAVAHDAATAQCNGAAYNGQPYRPDYDTATGKEDGITAWGVFCEHVRAEVSAIFGGTLPTGFRYNQDPRGYSLLLNCEKTTIPSGLVANWGGDGCLAAEIND